jgi:hypothetical protein
MDGKMAKEVIAVIRTERKRRLERLKNEDSDAAEAQWLFTDNPFIHEVCLMVLVGLRHQVERELISLAACVAARTSIGQTITLKQYQKHVTKQQEQLRKRGGWPKLMATLNPKSSAEERSMKTLRLLANCLKHASGQKPNKTLLKHLGLLPKPKGHLIVGYMPVPESDAFRESLAKSVNLPQDADYCMIAEKFVDLANKYLEDVRKNTNPARVRTSLSEFFA